MKTFFKIIGVVFGGVWIIYMSAIAFIMNTHWFEKLADMDNEELTHVNFKGAFSPYPGLLWARHAKVFISDQNVSISVYLDNTTIKFDLKPIYEQKTIRVTDLRTESAWVNLGMKTLEQTLTHISRHTELKDVNLDVKRARGQAALKNHIKLDFQHLKIERLSHIDTSIGNFEGDLALDGGFRIQPGAEVEVYPTDLIINNGKLPGQFTSVQGKAHVTFDRFFIPDAPGNAVFPFINATLDLAGVVQSLDFLNLTLRKLPNYQLNQGQTNVKLNLVVDHGKLQAGSGMRTDPSHVVLETPDVRATGDGQIVWKVLPQDTSELVANLHSIQVQQIKDINQQGKISDLNLKLTLYGNSMVDAFHGLASDMRLKNIEWNFKSPVRKGQRAKNITYKGRIEGNGRVLGVSGVLPRAAEKFWKSQSTHLDLELKPLEVTTSFLPLMTVTGTLGVVAKPVDFSASAMAMPKITTKLKIAVKDYGFTLAEGSITNVNYLLAPYHEWKGHLDLKIADTNPFVKALRDAHELGAVLGKFADVRDLTNNIDWEVGDEYSWFRVNEINSSGIWKGYGSLINGEDGLLGAFEVKVASVPVGIRIFPDKTDVKLLPSKDWYNALIIKQPSLSSSAKP